MTDAHEAVDVFFQVGDLHFWRVVWNPLRMANKRLLGNANLFLRRRHRFPMDRAEDVADALVLAAARRGRCHVPVLLTGDLTCTATDEEFALAAAFVQRLADRGLSVHVMPGNHDVYTFESVRARRFERAMARFVPPEGYPARVDLPGGTPLLMLNTARPNVLSARGCVAPDLAGRVAGMLEDCPRRLVVANHYPLLPSTGAYASPPSHQLRNAGLLRQVLGESGREVLYVCGHVHRFSLARDSRYANLLHLSGGAFFYDNRHEGIRGDFAEVHVTGSGFGVYRHSLSDEWSRTPVEPADAPG